MTIEMYLDPDELVTLEPYEGDDVKGQGISPFAVPEAIWVDVSKDRAILRFKYPGGETAGPEPVQFGDARPALSVLTSQLSGKVLDVVVAMEPGEPIPFDVIANTLEEYVPRLQRKGEQFSYQMIARVLRRWGEQINASVAQKLPV